MIFFIIVFLLYNLIGFEFFFPHNTNFSMHLCDRILYVFKHRLKLIVYDCILRCKLKVLPFKLYIFLFKLFILSFFLSFFLSSSSSSSSTR
ncbi:hypothetical protein Hanom_Chr07g00671121 [Helianthus anomalus]